MSKRPLPESLASNSMFTHGTTSSATPSQDALQDDSSVDQPASSRRALSYSEATRKASKQQKESNDLKHDKSEEASPETDIDYWPPITSPNGARPPHRQASSQARPQPSKTEDVFTSPMHPRIPRSLSESVAQANQGSARRIVSADVSLGHSGDSSLRVPHSTIPPAPISNLDFVNDLMDDGVGGAISRSTSVTTLDSGTLSTVTSSRSFSNLGASRAVSRTSTILTEMYFDHDMTPTAARTSSQPNFEAFQAGLTPQKGLSGSASSPVNSRRRSTHEKRVVALQGYAAVPSPQVLTPSRKDQPRDNSMDDTAMVAAYLDSELDETYHSHNTSFEVEEPSFYASAETSIVVPSADTSFHGVVTGIEGFGGVLGEMELLDESETAESSGSSAADCTDEDEKENRPVTRPRLPSLLDTLRPPPDGFGDAPPPSAASTTFERSLPHDRTPLSLLHALGDGRSSIWNTYRSRGSVEVESTSSDEPVGDTDNLDAQYRRALASKYVPNNSWSPELDETDMRRFQLYGASSISSPDDPGSTSFNGSGFVPTGNNGGPVTALTSPVLVLKASPGVIGSHLPRLNGASGSPQQRRQLQDVRAPTATTGTLFSPYDRPSISLHDSGSPTDLVGLGIRISAVETSVVPSAIVHSAQLPSPKTDPVSGPNARFEFDKADRHEDIWKIEDHWETKCERPAEPSIYLEGIQPTTGIKELDGGEKDQGDGSSTDETSQGAFVHLSAIGSVPGQHTRGMRRVSQEPSPRLPVILEVSSPPVSMHASVQAQSAGRLSEAQDPFWPYTAPITRANSPDLSIVKPCGLYLPLPFSDPANPNFIPDWWYGPAGGQKRTISETALSVAMGEMWEQIPNVIAPINRSFGVMSRWDLESEDEHEQEIVQLRGYVHTFPNDSTAVRSKPDETSTTTRCAQPTLSAHSRLPVNKPHSNQTIDSTGVTQPSSTARIQTSQAVRGAGQAVLASNSSFTAQHVPTSAGVASLAVAGPPAVWNGHVPQYAIYATNTPSAAYAANGTATFPVLAPGNPRVSSTTSAPPTSARAMLSHGSYPQSSRVPPPPYSFHQMAVPSSSAPPPGIPGRQYSTPNLSHANLQPPLSVPLQQRQQPNHVHASLARTPTPAAFSHPHQHQHQHQQSQQQHLYPGPRFPASMIQQHQPHAQLQRGGGVIQPPRLL